MKKSFFAGLALGALLLGSGQAYAGAILLVNEI